MVCAESLHSCRNSRREPRYEQKIGTLELCELICPNKCCGFGAVFLQVVQAKVPDLHGLEDISEYVAGGMGGGVSDSEVEDEESKITLPDDYVGRGNVKSQKRREPSTCYTMMDF